MTQVLRRCLDGEVALKPDYSGFYTNSKRGVSKTDANAQQAFIEGDFYTRLFSALYFLATKLGAFKDRGEEDGRFSTDFMDIFFVLNNRGMVWNVLAEADELLFQYLKEKFGKLLKDKYKDEWVRAQLDYHEQKRVRFILGCLAEFAEGGQQVNSR